MAAASDQYLLVVFDEVEDQEAVRALLCRVTGLHPTDATQWIARMPCVGARPLKKAEIQEILDGLYDLGIAAEARVPSSIPSFTPVRNAHEVACMPEGLRVLGLRGEPIHWIPYDKVELINAAWVDQEDETRSVGAAAWTTALRNAVNTMIGRPRLLIGRRERTMRVAREPRREIILIRREPQIALRFAEEALNYAYLGPKLRPTAGENFPLFLQDLSVRVETATLTKSTQLLLKGVAAEVEGARFPSTKALIDDSILRLLWRWYHRDRKRDLDGPGG